MPGAPTDAAGDAPAAGERVSPRLGAAASGAAAPGAVAGGPLGARTLARRAAVCTAIALSRSSARTAFPAIKKPKPPSNASKPAANARIWPCELSIRSTHRSDAPSKKVAAAVVGALAGLCAVAIGLINMCANLAGYLGNHATGWMKSHGAGDAAVLLFLAASYLLGAVIISLVKLNRPSVPAVNESIALKQTVPQ